MRRPFTSHPLNRGRVAFWVPARTLFGGSIWWDLCRSTQINLASFASGYGWRSAGGPQGGGALWYNGSAGNASTPTLDWSMYQTITIASWFYIASYTNTDLLLFERSSNYNNNLGGILIDPNASTVKFQLGMNDTGVSATGLTFGGFTRPSTSKWHRLLAVFDMSTNPNTITAYIDGAVQSFTYTKQQTTIANFGTQPCFVGSRNNSSLRFNGGVGSVEVWGRGLSAAEAALDYREASRNFPHALRRKTDQGWLVGMAASGRIMVDAGWDGGFNIPHWSGGFNG